MTKASSAIEGNAGTIFLRKATGLLREVSLLDAFIMNTFGMNIAVGAVFLFLQAPVGVLDLRRRYAPFRGRLRLCQPRLASFSGMAARLEPGYVADLLLDRL